MRTNKETKDIMKKILLLFICMFLASCSTASIGSRVGMMPDGKCTRDINIWGNSGNCFCNEGETYDERAGLCLTAGADEEITIQGSITAGMVAVGGETTGVEIRTHEGVSYELIVKVEDDEKLQNLSGQQFEVKGEIIIIKSVELQERRVIIVNSLHVLE